MTEQERNHSIEGYNKYYTETYHPLLKELVEKKVLVVGSVPEEGSYCGSVYSLLPSILRQV